MTRRSVHLTGGTVRRLSPSLVYAEQRECHDTLGDCPPCRGTGTVVIQACLAGEPHTPVRACTDCAGTGWMDRIDRTPHVPPTHWKFP
jgi:hypothetical protein